MKKFLKQINLMMLVVVALVGFTACSDDDNQNSCYFTVGTNNLHISGSTEDMEALTTYMNQVSDAYYKVLGMSEDNNTLIINGDYKDLKKEMKAKFDSAELPAEPTVEITYSFDIVLYGADLTHSGNLDLEDMDVVARKTFAN